ncbi:MAG: hypothetical protein ABWX90_03815 [Candidatus Saccharimonadales bacterium]
MKTLTMSLWYRDSIKWTVVAFVVFAGFAWALSNGKSALAQQSELTQQIKPIECIFTTTQTGNGAHVDSTCDNQPIPLVASVDINSGRPLVRGSFDSVRSIMLRVLVNGRWYVSGIDARLTTNANLWALDLTGIPMSLSAGVYTVAVEVETVDGLVLRNASAATFEVLQRTIKSDAPPLPFGRSGLVAPFFSITTVPFRAQIDDWLSDSFNSSPPVEKEPETTTQKDSSETIAGLDMKALFIITGLNALAVGAILYAYLRYKRW